MYSSTTWKLGLFVAALLLVGCGKSKDQTPVATKPEPAPQPAAAPRAAAPSPSQPRVRPSLVVSRPSPARVMVSANDSVHPVVSQGWPVVIEVMILLEPHAGVSLKLANPAGPWSEALKLECKGVDGSDRSGLFKPAYVSQKSIELTRERSGLLVWVLDSVELGTMPEGTYKIRAVVDEKKLGGVLPTGLTSAPIVVTVAASAVTSTAGAAQRKCIASITACVWKSDYPKALAIATEYLAVHPNDVAVLFTQGKAHESQGKKKEALASYEAALAAAEEHKRPMGENFAIQRAILDLRRELATK